MELDEKMAQGLLWADTDEYMEEQIRAKELMYEFNHSRPSETEKRDKLIRQMFGKVEGQVWIMQPITIARGKYVSIGEGTYINSNLTLVDDYKITIGRKCLIAPNVTICTTGHPVHYALRPHGENYSFPVTIGDGVWIGSGAIILPGVTIGEHSVIGAGSVVTKDIPADVVAAGNPCRVLRRITEHDREYYYHDRKII